MLTNSCDFIEAFLVDILSIKTLFLCTPIKALEQVSYKMFYQEILYKISYVRHNVSYIVLSPHLNGMLAIHVLHPISLSENMRNIPNKNMSIHIHNKIPSCYKCLTMKPNFCGLEQAQRIWAPSSSACGVTTLIHYEQT